MEVRLLRESDDRTTFRSGHDALDRFFQQYAGQNQFRFHIGTTYVAIDSSSGEIVGFVTVASCSIEARTFSKRYVRSLPAYPIPALRIARMAVAVALQRGGIGAQLMRTVFSIAHDQARRSGCAFVVVDAKPGSDSYYERWGFEFFPVLIGEIDARPALRSMFLAIGAIPVVSDPLPGG
jgi:GNAT superfamily N-acetyltransferase